MVVDWALHFVVSFLFYILVIYNRYINNMAKFTDCLQSYKFLKDNNLDYKKIKGFGSAMHTTRLKLTKLIANDPSNPIIFKTDKELLEIFQDEDHFSTMQSETTVNYSWIDKHEESILRTIETKRVKAEQKGLPFVYPVPYGSGPVNISQSTIPDPQPTTEPIQEQVKQTPPTTESTIEPIQEQVKEQSINTKPSNNKLEPKDCKFDTSELDKNNKVLVRLMKYMNSPIWQMLIEELDECDFDTSLIKGNNYNTEYFNINKPYGNQYYTIRLIKSLKIIE